MKTTITIILALLLSAGLVLAKPCDKEDPDSPCQKEKTYHFPANDTGDEKEKTSDIMQCQGKGFEWVKGRMNTCLDCHRFVNGKWTTMRQEPAANEVWPTYLYKRVEGDSIIPVYVLQGIHATSIFEILNWLTANPKYRKLVLEIQSPGGDVFDALRIIGNIEKMQAMGVTVVTELNGIAASAGALIFLAGDDRRVAESALLMFHELWTFSFFSIQSVSDAEEKAIMMRKIQDNLNTYISKRSGVPKEELDRRVKNKDWWLTGTEAVEQGFATGYLCADKQETSKVIEPSFTLRWAAASPPVRTESIVQCPPEELYIYIPPVPEAGNFSGTFWNLLPGELDGDHSYHTREQMIEDGLEVWVEAWDQINNKPKKKSIDGTLEL